MMMRVGWILTLMGAATLWVGCGNDTECGEFPLDDQQRQCVVETIDDMVQESYPFADYKGVDLEEFSRTLHASVEGAEEGDDVRFLSDVNYAVSLLEDGHTRLEKRLPASAQATAPISVERQNEKLLITGAGLERPELVGRRIGAVDGVDVDELLADTSPPVRDTSHGEVLSGPERALVGGEETAVELTLADGTVVEMNRRLRYDTPQVERINDDIGYLQLETFGFIDDLSRVDEAVNEVMDTRGLIIDLRGNGGGYPSVSEGLFARLIDEESPSFRMVDVDGKLHRELEMEPRGETYDGEVVLLVDGGTYSASNFFAHRMDYHDRGILVGRPTGGGSASPSNGAMILPGVWFQVSTYVVRDPNGAHTESGITPTLPVNARMELEMEQELRQTLTNTGDPIMDRALRYLEGLQ